MEFCCNHESVWINEVIFDDNLEQSVELEHLLPDYCPSIFKVLKCKLTPKITSERIAGEKLHLNITVGIKVVYVAEESNEIRTVEQKMVFSKTADLHTEPEHPTITVEPKCDYVNCRVVNPKRLDIRGAIRLHCTVTDQKCKQVLSHATGGGIQMKKDAVMTSGVKKTASKQFTVREELEIGAGKPAVGTILSSEAVCVVSNVKVIANKVICKGEATIRTLYLPEEGEGKKPERIENTVLLSQIMDLPGVEEGHICVVDLKATDLNINIREDAAGEKKVLGIELTVLADCVAEESRLIETVCDLFSTCYETERIAERVKLESPIGILNEITICKETLDFPGDQISCIYDVRCEDAGGHITCEKGKICLSGNLNIEILAMDQEMIPCVLERNIPYTYELESASVDENTLFRYCACILSVGYNIVEENRIELRIEWKTAGCLYRITVCDVITDLSLNTEMPKRRKDNVALKLYFADEGESVWEIAKQYNTCVDSIISDNALPCDRITKRGMVLIPIVD